MKEPTPPPTADKETSDSSISGSIRQSPPPIKDDSKIPPGAVISPPDSAQNSSDDEVLEMAGSRGRTLENLAELQAAIRVIEQRKESSPTRKAEEISKANQALTMIIPTDDEPVTAAVEQAMSGLGLRKIAHNRSKTETSLPIYVDMETSSAIETPRMGSEEDSDEDEPERSRRKPQMLRKKSGELVRPALRPASARRRPSSMPGTPTFGKAVHFDSHLEHVRHFLQVDRPLAVSAGSSPVESHDSDSEFPFDEASPSPTTRSPPFEWEIVISNFPADNPIRLSQPVRVERVFLSSDNKTLVGSVAVANLAFNKWVVARFTLDYWKTTSEVVAEFNHDVRQPKLPDGRDRFNFNIKLADLANLEAKTMFFCVKYCVNGQEHWDNNNGHNFQVDFRKKAKPQNGKKGMQGAGSRPAHSLPRSNKKPVPNGKPRVPVAFDDFGDGFDAKYNLDFKQPVDDYLGDNNPIRLKGVKSAVTLSSGPLRKSPNPNGQAFGNRYDFGASLSAAINAANTVLGDKSGLTMKSSTKAPPKVIHDADDSTSPLTMSPEKSFKAAPKVATPIPGTDSPKSNGSEKVMATQSYNELLDKYCFVRTNEFHWTA